jgi:mannose-6-phosphate isomerase-like protein (cupin superfamily)
MDNNKGTDIQYGITELPQKSKPIKHVEKYWGNMTTLFENEDITVKRIFMKADTQSSLEYHCKKKESYFIETGTLKVGIRVGRAKNKSLILNEGDIFHIPIGLMHMRIALTNCVIIEYSTKDDDSDSHIVEDGRYYIHKEEWE